MFPDKFEFVSDMTSCVEMSFTSLRTHLSDNNRTAVPSCVHISSLFCFVIVFFIYLLFIYFIYFYFVIYCLYFVIFSILRTYFDKIQWME